MPRRLAPLLDDGKALAFVTTLTDTAVLLQTPTATPPSLLTAVTRRWQRGGGPALAARRRVFSATISKKVRPLCVCVCVCVCVCACVCVCLRACVCVCVL